VLSISLTIAIRIILLLFTAAWTVLFITAFIFYAWNGITAFLANLAASTLWLVITLILWASFTLIYFEVWLNAIVGCFHGSFPQHSGWRTMRRDSDNLYVIHTPELWVESNKYIAVVN
jgi:hypothetical protein